MKTIIILMALLSSNAWSLSIGDKAPQINLKGHPTSFDLSKHKGKFVILEWYNDGCPFVRKHYDSGNMQALQKKYGNKVSWVAINSSAPGKQGHLENMSVAKKRFQDEKMKAKTLIKDVDGKVGMKYEAKTTPHMYIIDPKGTLIYQGAIDSIASADPSDIKKSENYIVSALDSALSGKPIKQAKTRPYGCSVKY
ncbi:MAG: thiol-disulfide isomerase/thioredoxin [Bacteriovoracaceae bacterium]|jgi:thiol-disulfide isomerase/thioredoxin